MRKKKRKNLKRRKKARNRSKSRKRKRIRKKGKRLILGSLIPLLWLKEMKKLL